MAGKVKMVSILTPWPECWLAMKVWCEHHICLRHGQESFSFSLLFPFYFFLPWPRNVQAKILRFKKKKFHNHKKNWTYHSVFVSCFFQEKRLLSSCLAVIFLVFFIVSWIFQLRCQGNRFNHWQAGIENKSSVDRKNSMVTIDPFRNQWQLLNTLTAKHITCNKS